MFSLTKTAVIKACYDNLQIQKFGQKHSQARTKNQTKTKLHTKIE